MELPGHTRMHWPKDCQARRRSRRRSRKSHLTRVSHCLSFSLRSRASALCFSSRQCLASVAMSMSFSFRFSVTSLHSLAWGRGNRARVRAHTHTHTHTHWLSKPLLVMYKKGANKNLLYGCVAIWILIGCHAGRRSLIQTTYGRLRRDRQLWLCCCCCFCRRERHKINRV